MYLNYQKNPNQPTKQPTNQKSKQKNSNKENSLEYLNHYLIHMSGTHCPGFLELILSDFVVQLCWLFKILKREQNSQIL